MLRFVLMPYKQQAGFAFGKQPWARCEKIEITLSKSWLNFWLYAKLWHRR
jgi:hypothetical protein